jgi:hypothetical protein
MIDVAISALYTEIIADGLRLQAWHEPELVALQKQLVEINLPAAVAASFQTERAGVCQTLLVLKPREVIEMFRFKETKPGFWERVTDPTYLLMKCAPRGWIYQNLAVVSKTEQSTTVGSFDSATGLVHPGKAADASREVERVLSQPLHGPARVAIPHSPGQATAPISRG